MGAERENVLRPGQGVSKSELLFEITGCIPAKVHNLHTFIALLHYFLYSTGYITGPTSISGAFLL